MDSHHVYFVLVDDKQLWYLLHNTNGNKTIAPSFVVIDSFANDPSFKSRMKNQYPHAHWNNQVSSPMSVAISNFEAGKLLNTNLITTFTGKKIDVMNPNPDDIDILDIAHSLSQQCRWGGHSKVFYSVAQHSFMCYWGIPQKQYKFEALMHDASEAYLIDVPRPIKLQLTNYKEIEDNLMRIIAKKFGFEYPLHPDVKQIDSEMLVYEHQHLIDGKCTITAHSPMISENIFLRCFRECV